MNLRIVMLSFAGLCGLAAYFVTTRYLHRGKPAADLVDVIVAAKDLRAEEVITPELLKTIKMEKTAVPIGTVVANAEAEGRWVQVPMLENEPIMERKLAERGSPPGMIARIPKGERGYAIDVTEQSGVSGFVLPGHRVDVIQSLMKKEGQSETTPVLQDVLVLAAGTALARTEDRSIQSRTVTLALKPEQVEILVGAKATGTLSLALRGLNDHTIVEVPKPKPAPVEETPEMILAKAPPPPAAPAPEVLPPPPPPAPKQKIVHIYRGVGNPDGREKVRIDLGENNDLIALPADDGQSSGNLQIASPESDDAPAAKTRTPE